MVAKPPETSTAQRITAMLRLLEDRVPLQRRLLHAGDRLYRAGDGFEGLYVVHSGSFKVVELCPDGRGQLVALPLRGDWLGFDGIATGRYRCDAMAIDVGEAWTVRYDPLLQAGGRCPQLLAALHHAMSREIDRGRRALMSLCTLPADARVADFLASWAQSLADRGLCDDRIVLRLTRAEIGNLLGMKLETVSRALSRLVRDGVIRFDPKKRRTLEIPEPAALQAFVQRSLAAPAPGRPRRRRVEPQRQRPTARPFTGGHLALPSGGQGPAVRTPPGPRPAVR